MSPRDGRKQTAVAVPGWSGLLLVDKPTGPTSHDVVARARRVLGERAIGHLGTLDPAASGLLVLVIGVATRCGLVWQGGMKTYTGRARFGLTTDTQDVTGRVLAERPVRFDAGELVARTAREFVGRLDQVPPMVSALKHRGEPLHRIARRGGCVERAARSITVEAWEWTALALPEGEFVIRCSGGTYVRTLVHDLGVALGCGAVLSALRRTASVPFAIEDAVSWELLCAAGEGFLGGHGVGLDDALRILPSLVVDPQTAQRVVMGQQPRVSPGDVPMEAGPRSVVFRDAADRALALGELRAAGDGQALACPHVVFPPAGRPQAIA